MTGREINFVHNDEIWKDHVRNEMKSFLRKWPEKWGFLKEEYKNMHQDLHGFVDGKSPEDGGMGLKLPPIPGAAPRIRVPPGEEFPRTTAQQIGWRATKPECQLEIYGRYAPNARGQIGIEKLFKWPREGI